MVVISIIEPMTKLAVTPSKYKTNVLFSYQCGTFTCSVLNEMCSVLNETVKEIKATLIFP